MLFEDIEQVPLRIQRICEDFDTLKKFLRTECECCLRESFKMTDNSDDIRHCFLFFLFENPTKTVNKTLSLYGIKYSDVKRAVHFIFDHLYFWKGIVHIEGVTIFVSPLFSKCKEGSILDSSYLVVDTLITSEIVKLGDVDERVVEYTKKTPVLMYYGYIEYGKSSVKVIRSDIVKRFLGLMDFHGSLSDSQKKIYYILCKFENSRIFNNFPF